MEENEEIKNFLSECKNMLIHIDMLETTQRFTNNFEKAIKQNLSNPIKTRQLQNLVNQFDMLLNQFIEEEN
jgi:ABC-type bacteriocin/lantibiotic exporter with double-glycine peptidase domain